MLTATQDDHNKNRTWNEKEHDRLNGIMAQEKRNREIAQHDKWAN